MDYSVNIDGDEKLEKTSSLYAQSKEKEGSEWRAQLNWFSSLSIDLFISSFSGILCPYVANGDVVSFLSTALHITVNIIHCIGLD